MTGPSVVTVPFTTSNPKSFNALICHSNKSKQTIISFLNFFFVLFLNLWKLMLRASELDHIEPLSLKTDLIITLTTCSTFAGGFKCFWLFQTTSVDFNRVTFMDSKGFNKLHCGILTNKKQSYLKITGVLKILV